MLSCSYDAARRAVCVPWATAAILMSGAAPTPGQEFRIESEVYVGDEEEPSSRTVTLFEETAVYEFVENPSEIIVYRRGPNAAKGEFILLDPDAEQRTDVDVARIESLIDKIARWARKQEDALLKFSADPDFQESFSEETGVLVLSHELWTYRAATVPVEEPGAIARFREFTDNYARLNTMLHGAAPPAPRLALNQALEVRGVAPVEIRRTINGDQKHQVRSTHLFSWRLSRDDRARLDDVRRQLANFRKVGNRAFLEARHGSEKQVARGQSR